MIKMVKVIGQSTKESYRNDIETLTTIKIQLHYMNINDLHTVNQIKWVVAIVKTFTVIIYILYIISIYLILQRNEITFLK